MSPQTISIDTKLHLDLGLSDEEFEAICDHLEREPTYTELAMFSVMWSEHCSYKSSKVHLETLPTEAPHVVVGPGEGAGIVEIAPGLAVAWKIESHNHPSFVEPFNGAATGVGGIVRDILSMGARPIALLDPLRFGALDDARTRYLMDGVVLGISSYGNAIGVPTVGGEVAFEDCYAGNPLVNVACLGVIEDRLMHGRAEGPGNSVVLIGSSTGRDGIGGASVLASAAFDAAAVSKRPAVQVGDPFTEKLLIEASLELISKGLVVGFQDLGAGGLSCPTSEMCAKAGTGMRVLVDRVPRREPAMEPFEVMISESQERMLAIVHPADVDQVTAVCHRWGLDAATVGEVTESGRVEVIAGAEVVADVPADALTAAAPVYERPAAAPEWLEPVQSAPPGDAPPADLAAALLALLDSPGVCSKRWAWEQYDHMIFLGTVVAPGADAAVVRLPGRTEAVALAVDGQARYCYLDPYEGARLAVAEAARNVACSGARPLAVTNCLNFGNPERPEVMWQFAEVVRGIADACRGLGTPVTGGNVSFYNETGQSAIFPTPVIGMLGALERAEIAIGSAWTNPDDAIVVVGRTDPADFGGSEYAKIINSVIAGRPPRLDIERERRLIAFLTGAVSEGLLTSAHDPSEGGLGVALAECALAGGHGCEIELPPQDPHRALFAETPSRAVVTCAEAHLDAVLQAATRERIEAHVIGSVGGPSLNFGVLSVDLDDVRETWENGLPRRLSDTIDVRDD
ncbi:MAG: phosphoribosylformylglycinamidine synthase subunit PurL [Actinomycetota bacterium]